jgi:glutaredoxin 3
MCRKLRVTKLMKMNRCRIAVLTVALLSVIPSIIAFMASPTSLPCRKRQSESAPLRASILESIAYSLKQVIVDAMAGGDYDAEKVNAEIDSFVKENPVAVISFTTCPYCSKAKAALDERGIQYTSWEINEEENRGFTYRAELGRRFKRTSVPAIFIRGNFIGGCNDGPGLLPLLASGEFEKLLASE